MTKRKDNSLKNKLAIYSQVEKGELKGNLFVFPTLDYQNNDRDCLIGYDLVTSEMIIFQRILKSYQLITSETVEYYLSDESFRDKFLCINDTTESGGVYAPMDQVTIGKNLYYELADINRRDCGGCIKGHNSAYNNLIVEYNNEYYFATKEVAFKHSEDKRNYKTIELNIPNSGSNGKVNKGKATCKLTYYQHLLVSIIMYHLNETGKCNLPVFQSSLSKGMVINHKDLNHSNNSYKNLEPIGSSENIIHGMLVASLMHYDAFDYMFTVVKNDKYNFRVLKPEYGISYDYISEYGSEDPDFYNILDRCRMNLKRAYDDNVDVYTYIDDYLDEDTLQEFVNYCTQEGYFPLHTPAKVILNKELGKIMDENPIRFMLLKTHAAYNADFDIIKGMQDKNFGESTIELYFHMMEYLRIFQISKDEYERMSKKCIEDNCTLPYNLYSYFLDFIASLKHEGIQELIIKECKLLLSKAFANIYLAEKNEGMNANVIDVEYFLANDERRLYFHPTWISHVLQELGIDEHEAYEQAILENATILRVNLLRIYRKFMKYNKDRFYNEVSVCKNEVLISPTERSFEDAMKFSEQEFGKEYFIVWEDNQNNE